MTAPRIIMIPAAQAAEIRQVSDEAIAIMLESDAPDTNLRAAALVRDLAATVVALHAEVERLRRSRYRHFDDVTDESQETVKGSSESLAYADGTVTDRAFTRPVWDMMEEEP
jgi:hypothetical protein